MQSWRYSDVLGAARISHLQSARSLPAVLDDIVASARVLCVHRPPCDDLPHFSRVVSTLRVPPPIFDQFFNSQHGYRGAYAASPYGGIEANDRVLAKLTPFVIASDAFKRSGVCATFASESLRSPSAKVWLAEVPLHLCPLCEGEWLKPTDAAPELTNGTWEKASAVEATWGCKAPYLTKLKLIGAFLSARYDEYVPFHKRRRAELIHLRGWA